MILVGKCFRAFLDYFNSIAPEYVKVKVTPMHGAEGVVVPTNFPGYVAASRAMEESFNKKPIPVRSGGSIPVVPLFEEILGLKTILFGFGLDSFVEVMSDVRYICGVLWRPVAYCGILWHPVASGGVL